MNGTRAECLPDRELDIHSGGREICSPTVKEAHTPGRFDMQITKHATYTIEVDAEEYERLMVGADDELFVALQDAR